MVPLSLFPALEDWFWHWLCNTTWSRDDFQICGDHCIWCIWTPEFYKRTSCDLISNNFLHCGIPGFMLAPQMVVICYPTLKHLLISILALLPLWTSQISIQTIDMSNFGNTLITLGLDAKDILLKIWFCLRIDSISLEVRCSWEFACR